MNSRLKSINDQAKALSSEVERLIDQQSVLDSEKLPSLIDTAASNLDEPHKNKLQPNGISKEFFVAAHDLMEESIITLPEGLKSIKKDPFQEMVSVAELDAKTMSELTKWILDPQNEVDDPYEGLDTHDICSAVEDAVAWKVDSHSYDAQDQRQRLETTGKTLAASYIKHIPGEKKDKAFNLTNDLFSELRKSDPQCEHSVSSPGI